MVVNVYLGKEFKVLKTNLKKKVILSSMSSISRRPLMVLNDVRMTLLPNLVFAGISQICRNKMHF